MHWAGLEASALGDLIAACPAWKRENRTGRDCMGWAAARPARPSALSVCSPYTRLSIYGDRKTVPDPYSDDWMEVFRSISHLLRHFLSSAHARRHTSSNSVTRNYCCRHAREVTLSFMDTLIALTYLPNIGSPPINGQCTNHRIAV